MKRLILAVSLLMTSATYGASITFKNEVRLNKMFTNVDDFSLREIDETLSEAHIWLHNTMYFYVMDMLLLDENDFEYIKRLAFLVTMTEIEYNKLADLMD